MDRFVDKLLPYLPGCPMAVIKAEVLMTAIRFCFDTWVWDQVEENTVAADSSDIVFSLPDNSRIIGMLIKDQFGRNVIDYTRIAETTTLDSPVTKDTTFETSIFLTPTHTAPSLPDFLYYDWFDAIESGTKVTLYMMPDKPWANPGMSQVEQTRYLNRMGEARLDVRKKNDQTPIRVTMRPFV